MTPTGTFSSPRFFSSSKFAADTLHCRACRISGQDAYRCHRQAAAETRVT